MLDQLKDGSVMNNVIEIGGYLKHRLQAVASKFKEVGVVRGQGLSIGMEIVHNSTEPNPSLCHYIRQKLFERQVREAARE